MGEAERIKLEQRYVGDVGTVDCPISYSVNTDGSICISDGWVLPAIEATRIGDFWKSPTKGVPNFCYEPDDAVERFLGSDLRRVTSHSSANFLHTNPGIVHLP